MWLIWSIIMWYCTGIAQNVRSMYKHQRSLTFGLCQTSWWSTWRDFHTTSEHCLDNSNCLNDNNLSSVGRISVIFWYSESLEKTLSDGMFSSNFSILPKFAHFPHLYIAHAFLSKSASKITFDFNPPSGRAHFKLYENHKLIEIGQTKLAIQIYPHAHSVSSGCHCVLMQVLERQAGCVSGLPSVWVRPIVSCQVSWCSRASLRSLRCL